MKPIEKELIQIKISDSYGFTKNTIYPIMQLLENSHSLYFGFLSPSPVFAFYKSNIAESKLDSIIEKLVNIIKENTNELEDTKISKCRDTYIIERNVFFQIINMPLGGINIYKKESIIFEQLEKDKNLTTAST